MDNGQRSVMGRRPRMGGRDMNVNFKGLGNTENNSMHFGVATGGKQSLKKLREEENKGLQGKTLKAADLSLGKDVATQKKLDARKEAMKKLGDVFSSQLKTDNDLASRTERMAKLEEEAVNAQKELDKVTQSKAELAEAYKDNLHSDAYITELINLDKAEEEWTARVQSAKSQKAGESATISAIHQALLKADPMVKAAKAADKIMEEANNEIVDELVNQAKEDIDEKLEEKIEDEKKAKEEKEEEEKKQVEREDSGIKDATQVIQTADTTYDKIQNEIQNLIRAQQLIEEDLKGLEVDRQL